MTRILVGMSTCGLSAGARDTYRELEKLVPDEPAHELGFTGCIGMCYREPLVEVSETADARSTARLTPSRARRSSTDICNGAAIEDYVVYRDEPRGRAAAPRLPFCAQQDEIVLRNCGLIDPESIDEYEAAGGYEALRKALLG